MFLFQYKNIEKMHTRKKQKNGVRGIFFIKFVLKELKKMRDLQPIYDGRNSFYGKAKVYSEGDGEYKLYSYDTLVCTLRGNGYYLNYDIDYSLLFSNTTLRHIKEFLRQYYKNEFMTKNDIIKNAKNSMYE
jgi:hypothetical protein